jgi:hypothetical protein
MRVKTRSQKLNGNEDNFPQLCDHERTCYFSVCVSIRILNLFRDEKEVRGRCTVGTV